MGNLFRDEALQAATAPLGVLLDVKSIRRRTVALIAVTLFSLVTALLIFGTYTRRSTVTGEITAAIRPVNVLSQHQGYISEMGVKVGDEVQPGQKLFRITTGRTTTSGEVGARSIAAIQRQEEKVKAIIQGLRTTEARVVSSLEQQHARYAALYEKSSRLLSKAEEGVRTFEATLQNYANYQKQGLITRDQYIYQLNNYYQQQSMLNGISAQNAQEQMQMITMAADIDTRRIEYQNQMLENEMRLRELERQRSAIEAESDVFVIAPLHARLESINTSIGQYVSYNDSLAQLLPGGSHRFQLTLWVPDRNLPYLKVGAPVGIRYDAFAWEKFGQFRGQIAEISSVPASLQEMSLWRSAPREELVRTGGNFYRVTCSLDEESFRYLDTHIPLTHGLTANVTLYLEKRPLWQWLISPLYEVRQSIKEPH
ncbi:HlyD family secretion protein [Pantoea sp. A4]|uniref:HlyD family secretion protein n=1 Tax=Pantoea sp. A4 TaxID=1225184 RepID=UPI000379DCF5|nr:HlyD family secretion protein [Pantoea sp. A4]